MEFYNKIQLLCVFVITAYIICSVFTFLRYNQGSIDVGINRRKLLQNIGTIQNTQVNVSERFVSKMQPNGIGERKAIIGKDERRPVDNPLEFPYNTIGKITMQCECGTGDCTGSIIGPRMVLTASQCVYDLNRCSIDPACCNPCTDYTFTPAQPIQNETYLVDGVIIPYGLTEALRNQKDILKLAQFDIAILKLDRNVPTKNLQTMSFEFPECEDGVQIMEVFIAGYPLDLDSGESMYYSKCLVKVIPCDPLSTINHTCDTEHGMGGATIWTKQKDGSVVIIGVHSRQEKINGTLTNAGVLLNNATTQYITELQDQFSN